MPAQIEELKLTHEKEMSALRADLHEIKTALLADIKPHVHLNDNLDAKKSEDTYNRPRGQRGFRRYRKCEECERKNCYRCFHCFVCGSSDHRMNVCPERTNQKNY